MNQSHIFLKLSWLLATGFLILFITACSDLKDTVSQQGNNCAASDCHTSTLLKQYPPDSGRHTEHLSTGLSCDSCHFNYNENALHKNGVKDTDTGEVIVFFNLKNTAVSWNQRITTCENNSCHKDADWYGSAVFGCTDCHSVPESGSHKKHSGDLSYECTECHNGYRYDPSHTNGTLDNPDSSPGMMSFGTLNPSGSYDNSTDTCSNLQCHGSGTPRWGSSSECGSCHGNPPLTGAHSKHVTDSGLACNECHLERGSGTSYHADGNPDVNVTTAVNPSGNYTPGVLPGTGTCDSLYCHGSDTPAWDGTVSCGSCHGTPPATGAHLRHVNDLGYSCSKCHNGSVHGSMAVEVDFDATNPSGNYVPGSSPGTGTCNSLYCHGSGSPAWDGTITCDGCHGNPPLTGSHSKHVTESGYECSQCHFSRGSGTSYHVNGNPDINFNSSHSPSGHYSEGACSNIYCHGNFTGGNNGTIQPVWGETVSCSTNSCHGGNASGNPACSSVPDSKHGTHISAIMNMNNPSTGLVYTEEESCSVCHSGHGYGTSSHINMKVDAAFDYTPPEGLAGTILSGGDYDTISGKFQNIACSSTYCHGNFAGGNAVTVNWGESVSDPGWCGSCHTTSPVSVKHSEHLALYPGECGYCHQGYTSSSAPAGHVSLVKDVKFNYPHSLSISSSYDNATKTCSGVYCHGNFPPVTYTNRYDVTAVINPGNSDNPVWQDSSTAPCGSCHGNPDNNYSSLTHGGHTDAIRSYAKSIFFGNPLSIESCDACHNYGDDTERSFDTTSTQGSYNTVNHADFSINDSGVNDDVNFKADDSDLASRIGSLVASKTSWDPATTTCSNSWCHGNFSNGVDITGYNGTPDWLNGTTGTCGTEACHSSDIHGNYGCGGHCHGSSPNAEHVNGTIGF